MFWQVFWLTGLMFWTMSFLVDLAKFHASIVRSGSGNLGRIYIDFIMHAICGSFFYIYHNR